eukprot:TRINITY_DN5639_c0_g1_i1.p1 TRINITY_DN5639_c0_g1~~TRINITY_DN5639_c0_g1_i1.p1  ORF type:complete len:226 (-),score=56.40 TRINITY_DN5639_c0_g1_i1:109-786(-)
MEKQGGRFNLEELVEEFRRYSEEKTIEATWEPFVEVNNEDVVTKVWRRPEPDGSNGWQSWAIVSGVVPHKLLQIYGDYEFRKQYMEYTTSYLPLEREDKENGDYNHVVYWRVTMPLIGYFTSEREYLFRRTQTKIGDCTVVLDESLTEHALAPLNDKYVRISSYNMAIVVKELEGGKTEVLMKYLTPLNIAMPLPQKLLNWGASVGLNKYLNAVKKAIQEYDKKT